MVKVGELLARTAGLNWNPSLDRLAGAHLNRLAQPHGTVDALLSRAAGQPELAQALAVAFTVGETWFHRFGEQLDAAALALRDLRRPARLWSAGCSTGEEVYALLEACQRAGVDARALGTDLNPASVQAARRGTYGVRALRDTPQDRVARAFTVDGGTYHVKPDLRARAQFQVHNLLHAPPDGSFDVIACRNVLIYFTPDAAQQVYAHLARALHPGGYLLLAPSDPRPAPTLGLHPVRLGRTLLLRRPPARPHAAAARPAPVQSSPGTPAPPDAGSGAASSLPRARQAAFEAPHDPRAHLTLARAFLLAGRPDRAALSLRRAEACLSGAPDTWERAHLLADCAQVRGQIAQESP